MKFWDGAGSLFNDTQALHIVRQVRSVLRLHNFYLYSVGASCRTRLTKQFLSSASAEKHYLAVLTLAPATTASVQVSLPATMNNPVQFSQPTVTTSVQFLLPAMTTNSVQFSQPTITTSVQFFLPATMANSVQQPILLPSTLNWFSSLQGQQVLPESPPSASHVSLFTGSISATLSRRVALSS